MRAGLKLRRDPGPFSEQEVFRGKGQNGNRPDQERIPAHEIRRQKGQERPERPEAVNARTAVYFVIAVVAAAIVDDIFRSWRASRSAAA